MIDKQRIAWFIGKLSDGFTTYRYPLLFVGLLIYFLGLNHGTLHFFYSVLSIVFGAFAGVHILVSRHYLVNLEDEKDPTYLLYPVPAYLFFIYLLSTNAGVAAGLSFTLFMVGIAMFNIVDIVFRDLKGH